MSTVLDVVDPLAISLDGHGLLYTITSSGTEKSVEFVEDEDGVSLLYARWRLRKAG